MGSKLGLLRSGTSKNPYYFLEKVTNLVEVDTVCCENVWVSTRYVIVSYDLQNKLGKYVLCLEGTIKSVGPKGTKELASISVPRLFHILINDLD